MYKTFQLVNQIKTQTFHIFKLTKIIIINYNKNFVFAALTSSVRSLKS